MIYRSLIYFGTNAVGPVGQSGPAWVRPAFGRAPRVFPFVTRVPKVAPGQQRDDTDPVLDDFYPL